VARDRRDQADVRAFRRLDRTDAAVVRRVHVADLEPGALARQAARPERGETPLVRDLRQRVGLVHELRELRRPEELANRGHHRLRVDEVVRHRRRHFLVDRHLLLDGALHPDQPDAELVLEELAHGADAAVAPVIDPTSSFSGKKISIRSTFFSCAIEMTRGVSSSLASRITSPVDGSTTSLAANAPSSSASEISTASTFAFFNASIAFFVIFLPAWTVKCSPGTT